MAVTRSQSFDAQDNIVEGNLSPTGTQAISQTQARTGTSSLRCNPASGAAGYVALPSAFTWCHFGIYIATLPSVERIICGNSVTAAHIGLTSTGTLKVYDGAGGVIGTSSALTTGIWYWIGSRWGSFTGVCLQIDGIDKVSGTQTAAPVTSRIGACGTEASAVDLYIDDIILDDAALLAPSKVTLLLPTADSAVGTGWTLGTGTAISGNTGAAATDNIPLLGVADLAAGSDPKQIRNASANANVNYDATMTTYSAAGVGSGDTVLAVMPIVVTAAPVTTSSKQGTVGVASNPAITNVALSATGTAGAFWAGATAATFPTGWKTSWGTLTLSPSVTVGTAPVMRVTQVTSSTRIAMVCFVAMQVVWTPAAATQVPYINPMPALLAQ